MNADAGKGMGRREGALAFHYPAPVANQMTAATVSTEVSDYLASSLIQE